MQEQTDNQIQTTVATSESVVSPVANMDPGALRPEIMAPELTKKKSRLGWYFGLGFLGLVVAILVAVYPNRNWLIDWWRGNNYRPTLEMTQIRDALRLTNEGVFLFNASWPELNDNETFNQNCRSGEATIAVLGCYVNNNIYVYNIEEQKLDGIRELTTAHELLHAVYARMSDEDKKRFEPFLEEVYAANEETLKSDIETYDKSEVMEELYVRAGTEIKNLPDELEKHYARFFQNQDFIVSYYEKYIAAFREIENKLDELTVVMNGLKEEIDNKTAEYAEKVEQLEVEVTSFNTCAEIAGCFQSQAIFNERRAALMAEQDNLDELYQEISGLIDQYNAKVEEFNKNVVEGRRLNRVVNSYENANDLDLVK